VRHVLNRVISKLVLELDRCQQVKLFRAIK
jgi:hypothetical protein